MESDNEDMTIEEMILEDIKEWCEHYLLDGKSWDDHMSKFDREEHSKQLDKMMKIYFTDHIFPIDEYC